MTENQTKLAIIMRGLPGSGKSHWVEEYIASLPLEQAIAVRQRGYFSTDSYFIQHKSNTESQYRFLPHRLAEFHQQNLTAFIIAAAQSEPTVICDNTNMAHWEFSAYKAAAQAMGYQVRVMLLGEVSDHQHQLVCAERNKHGVGLEQIKKNGTEFRALT